MKILVTFFIELANKLASVKKRGNFNKTGTLHELKVEATHLQKENAIQ